MSYTSLWGNTTSFSGYGVQESTGFLVPTASITSVGQTEFAVNTTQFLGVSIQGSLSCSYDFSKAPEKTSCKYSEVVGGPSFNIAWLAVGRYAAPVPLSLHAPRNTCNLSQARQTPISGNYTSLYIGPNSNESTWARPLVLDWSDYGDTATASCGQTNFAGTQLDAVTIQFPQGVASVDPTVVQHSANTAGFSSSVTKGDVLVATAATAMYHGDFDRWAFSDSQGNTWTQQAAPSYQTTSYSDNFDCSTQAEGNTYDNTCFATVWTATASATGSDTVTLGMYVDNTYYGECECNSFSLFEVSNGVVGNWETGYGTCSSMCNYATSSLSFPSGSVVIGQIGTGYYTSIATGSGFTDAGSSDQVIEYSTSVSPPSTVPATPYYTPG